MAIGYDNGALNSQLAIYNNAAGTCSKFSLGSYFTVQTPAWYEFGLSADPGGAAIQWYVKRLDISSIPDAVGSFSANFPANSLWLSPMMHGCSMVTSALQVENGGSVWRS